MGKVPQMQRQGTRYEPYKNSSRRRASPPPDRWGIHAGSQDSQLNGSIFDFLEALNTRYGSRDLREIFRDHATQPGALGEAIDTWIEYDEVIIFLTSSFTWAAQTAVLLANSVFQIRGPREPELAIQRNGQSHWSNVPGPIPQDESRTSRPPVGQPDTRNVSFFTRCEESDCRTQLALPVFQCSEYPDAPTTGVSLRRLCLAVIS